MSEDRDFFELMKKVYGDKPPDEPVGIQFRQTIKDGVVYFRAEDVADMLDTLNQHKTARHIREHVYPAADDG